jgi:hypothetical protein
MAPTPCLLETIVSSEVTNSLWGHWNEHVNYQTRWITLYNLNTTISGKDKSFKSVVRRYDYNNG